MPEHRKQLSTTMICLHYNMYGALFAGEKRHAQQVLRDLGITYKHAVPQSLADQWWFYDCQGVPEELPSFITPMEQATVEKYLDNP